MNNRLYTIREVASILGVSTKTLRRWDQRGRFVPGRSAGNQRRYTYQQLQEFKIQNSKFKKVHIPTEAFGVEAEPLFVEDVKKEVKVARSLPSILSNLPSGSFLKNHFLLRHEEELAASNAVGTESSPLRQSLSEASRPQEREVMLTAKKRASSAFKFGFVIAAIALAVGFTGSILATKYNLTANLIAGLPQIKFDIRFPFGRDSQEKKTEISFKPQDAQAVLAAAAGTSDLVLNINVPSLFSQSVGIGTATVDSSAVLDIVSIDKGFLAPRMTTVQRDAISAPAAGLFVYNTDTNHYNMYNGTVWQGVFTSIGDSILGEAFTKDGKEGNSLYFHGTGGGVGQITGGAISGTQIYTLPGATGTFITTGNLTDITKVGTITSGVWDGTLLTKLGTITSGVWNGTIITVANGGTGIGTLTGIVLGNGTSPMTALTTSAGIAGAISDETGTGKLVFNTDPIFDGHILPTTTLTSNIGSSSLYFNNVYAANYYGGSSGTAGYWQRASNALSPTNITDDILLGATSTSSAKFGFLNVAGGSPTATIAGNLSLVVPTGNAPSAAFNLLNNGTLNFQRSPGGDAGLSSALFIQNNGDIGIGTTSPLYEIHLQKNWNGETDLVVENTTAGTAAEADVNVMNDSGYTASLGIYSSLTNTWHSMAANGAFIYSTAPAGFSMQVAGPIKFAPGGAADEMARFDTNGRLGLGTTAPLTALDVVGSASLSANLSLRGAGTAHTFNLLDNGTLNFQRSPGGDAGLATALFIQNNGNIGIGTTAPSALLSVGSTSQFQVNSAGAIAAAAGITSSGSITFSGLNTDKGVIYTNGTGGLLAQTAQGAANTVLHGNGAGAPTFSAVSLTADVTGTLPILNGGTNATTIGSAGSVPYSSGTAYVFSGVGTTGQALISGGTGSPTWYAPTAGSVLFAGASGILQQDNTSLFFDDTNNRLGIGTTTPLTALDVVGSASLSASLSLRGQATAHTFNILDNGTLNIQRSPGGDAEIASALFIQNNGNVGIGTTVPGATLDIVSTTAKSTGAIYGQLITLTGNPAAAQTGYLVGISPQAQSQSGNAQNFDDIWGTESWSYHAGTGTVTNAIGVKAGSWNNTSGTITNAYGNYNIITNASNGTINNAYAFYAANPSNSGTLSNNYGLYLENQTAGLTNYAIYSAGGTNYFGGNVGIGKTAPLTALDVVGSGSISANLSFSGAGTAHTFNILDNGTLNIQRSPGGDANLTTALFIQNNGYIGIGTTAPEIDLHVSGPSDTYILITTKDNTKETGLAFNDGAGGANDRGGIFMSSADLMSFYTGGSYASNRRMSITSIGNVGIGTTTPLATLDVRGTSGITPAASVSGQTSFAAMIVDNNGIGDLFTASKSGDTKFVIDNRGNVGIGYASVEAAYKLKIRGDVRLTNTPVGVSLYLEGSQLADLYDGTLHLRSGGSVVTFDGNDNVGIGTTNPLTALDVVGSGSISANLSFSGAGTAHTLNILDNGTLNIQRSPGGDAGLAANSALFIQNNGYVGIGTTAPEIDLHVSGPSDTYILITTEDNTKGTGLAFNDGVGGANDRGLIFMNSADLMSFYTGGSNASNRRMSITSIGNVGIGTTTPLATLDVRGISGTTPVASISGQTSFASLIVDNNGIGDLFTASKSGATKFVINNAGNVGIGTASPDPNSSLTVGGRMAVGGDIWYNGDGTLTLGDNINDEILLQSGTGDAIRFNVNAGTEAMRITSGGYLGIGNTTPLTALDVTGSASLSANVSLRGAGIVHTFNILDNGTLNFQRSPGGDADLASNSILYLGNNGNVGIGTVGPDQKLDILSGSGGIQLRLTSTDGSVYSDIKTDQMGYLSFAPTGSIATFSATVNPNVTSTYDLGSPTRYWNNLYANNIIGATSGTQGYWQRNSGALSPTNIADDILFGATSTSSAKFGFLNMAAGNPTASISGNLSLIVPTTAGANTFNLLNNSTLNFQRSPGGDAGLAANSVLFIQNNGNVGIGTTSPTSLLTVNGALSATTINGNTFTAGTGVLTLGASKTLTVSDTTTFNTNAITLAGGEVITFSASNAISLLSTGSTSVTLPTSGTLVSSVTTANGVSATNTAGALSFTLGTITPSTVNGLTLASTSITAPVSLQLVPTGDLTISQNSFVPFTSVAAGAIANTLYLKAGKVGILNTSPLTELDITGSASLSANLSLRGAGIAHTFNILDNGTLNFQRYPSGDAANNSSVLFLQNNGNVGVGTTDPNTNLVVSENTTDVLGAFKIVNLGSGDASMFFTADSAVWAMGLDNSDSNKFKISTDTGNADVGISTKLAIDTAGNVGINTASPLSKLDVRGTSGTSPVASVSGQTSFATMIVDNNGIGDLFTASKSGATKFVIANNGNVGIGTAAPGDTLDVVGTVGVGNITLNSTTDVISGINEIYVGGITTQDDPAYTFTNYTGTGMYLPAANALGFSTNSLERVRIDISGNVGIGNTTPLTALDVTGSASISANLSLRGAATAHTFNILDNGTLNIQRSPGGDAEIASALFIQNNGNVGIGTTVPGATLDIVSTTAKSTGAIYGQLVTLTGNPASAQTGYLVGFSPMAQSQVGNVQNFDDIWGTESWSYHAGTGTVTNAIGVKAGSWNNTSGTITNAYGNYNIITNASNGTINNAYAFYAANPSNSGTLGNNYGLYLENQTAGATNYAIYSAGGQSYFGGNIGIGTTNPLTALDIVGSASLSANLSLRGAGTAHTFDILQNGTLNIRRSPGGDAGLATALFIQNNGNVGIGTTVPTTALDITGGLKASGTVTFSNYNANNNLLYATVTTGLLAGASTDISSLCLLSGASAPTWAACPGGGSSNWTLDATNGVLRPNNNTLDLLIGGTATSSAKFAFINIAGGNPTASISGNLSLAVPTTAGANTFNLLNNSTLNFQRSPGGDAGLAANSVLFMNNNGYVGIGTTVPGGLLTLANNGWFSGISTSSGVTNMFKVNTADQIQVGAALNIDGGITFPTDGGNLVMADLPLGSSAQGTAHSYTFKVGSDNILTVYGENSATAGTLQNGRVGIGTITPTAALDIVGSASVSAGFSLRGAGVAHTFNILDNGTLNVQRSPGGDAGLATALFIQNNGSVGIGNTSPSALLSVGTSSQFQVNSSGTVTMPTPFTLGATSVTTTGTQLNYLSLATGATGTTNTNVVFSTSPTFTTSVLTGSTTFAVFNTTATTLSFGGAATTLTIGGTPTTAVTHNYSANATANATTKTINFGTGGVSGSTTNINIGSATGGALGTTTINSPTLSFVSATISANLSLSGAGTAHTFNILQNGTLNIQRSPGGDAGLATALFIQNNGNIGIGTTTPLFKLDVQDSQAATAAAQIFNTSTDVDADGLAIKLGFTNGGSETNFFTTFLNGNGLIQGMIKSNASSGVTYQTNGVADFAEYFKKDKDQIVPFGSVVCLKDNGLAAPCNDGSSESNKIIGVASQYPSFLGGENLGDRSVPVGLVGQVRTRVSTANGAIKIGDPLTTSSVSGVAVKATSVGQILGKAVESYDGQGEGAILVSVNISWYNPSVYVSYDGTLAGMAATVEGIGNQVTLQGELLQEQIASASAQPIYTLDSDPLFKDTQDKIADLQSKLDILTQKVEMAASTSAFLLEIQSQGVLGASTSASLDASLGNIEINNATISNDLMVLGRTTVTDLGVTGNINAGILTINGINGEINTLSGDLKLQSEGLGGIDILSGKVVIDTKGNMAVTGTVTADKIEAKTYSVLGDQSIGSGTIPTGATFIEISTPVASTSSKIFLTATTLTDKQITVVDKADGKFRVAIPSPTTVPISFDWWIVENR